MHVICGLVGPASACQQMVLWAHQGAAGLKCQPCCDSAVQVLVCPCCRMCVLLWLSCLVGVPGLGAGNFSGLPEGVGRLFIVCAGRVASGLVW